MSIVTDEASASPSHKTRLAGLDALRGIAALVVVAGHAVNSIYEGPFGGRFYIAVDVFFALSGFVMARTYEHRMPSPAQFLLLRIKRLWPIMAIGGVLGGLSVLNNPPDSYALLVIAGVLLVPTRIAAQAFPLNSPTWSILSELAVNGLHGLGLFRIRPLLLAACGLWLLVLTYLSSGGIGVGPFVGEVTGSVLRAAGSYCIGIAIFRSRDRLPRMPFWPVYLLPCLLLIPGFGGPIDLLLATTTPTLALLCAFDGAGSRLLLNLGAISFPLYAMHEPVQRMIQQANGNLVLSIIGPVAVVAAAMKGFEAAKKRWLTPPPSEAPQ